MLNKYQQIMDAMNNRNTNYQQPKYQQIINAMNNSNTPYSNSNNNNASKVPLNHFTNKYYYSYDDDKEYAVHKDPITNKYYYYKDSNSKPIYFNDYYTKLFNNAGKNSVTVQQYLTQNNKKPTNDRDLEDYLNGSGGGGGTNITVNVPAPAQIKKVNWQGRDVNEVAKELGFQNYTYEDILKMYNDATNKKFDEFDTQMKRAKADNLRTLENTYDTYLNQLRSDRANAIANGMTKGASTAMQLLSMYTNANTINENQEGLSNTLYDLAQQRATALEENRTNARQENMAFQQYIGNLLGTYEANSVNELAARLAQDAQIKAAQIGANATTNAAKIGATSGTDMVLGLYRYLYGDEEGTQRYINQIERDSLANQAYINWKMSQGK